MYTRIIRIGLGFSLTLLLGMAIALGMGHGVAYAADGDLDTTFDGDGKQTTNYISRYDEARAVAIQPDGKIVVVGTTFISDPNNYDFFVARYNPNGSLDPTFDFDGMFNDDFTGRDDRAYGVAIQPDGKIVVAGVVQDQFGGYKFVVARYTSQGFRDTSFGNNGFFVLCTDDFCQEPDRAVANSVAIQPDGKIVAAGYVSASGGTNFLLVRLNPDGFEDNSFDGDGVLSTNFFGGNDEVRSVAIQSNGKIVAAGNAQVSGNNYDFAVARYNPSGTLDAGFSTDGKATIDYFGGDDGAYGMAIQSDGKIVVAGSAYAGTSSNYDLAVARLTSTGSLDTSFSDDGIFSTNVGINGTIDEARAVAIQSDGKIVAAGYAPGGTSSNNFALVRLNVDGTPDGTFSGNGEVTTDFIGGQDAAQGVAIQSDGKIVAVGYADMGANNNFDFALTRYLADGTTCSIQFPDVPPGSTFYDFVRCLACRGIVSGLPDGTFGPNNPVTRGQLSKIVSNAAGFAESFSTSTFEDVPVGSTFHLVVERLFSRGIVNGFGCGGVGEPCVGPGNRPYFRPSANVTRGQTSKIVASARGLPAPPSGQQTFEDVPEASTFWQWIEALATNGAISGFPCGNPEPCVGPGNRSYFRPNNQVTRGQSAKIVSIAFFPGCTTPQK
ncbi:MAG: S-layer homology domain-containing protein [Chloroflexia bacterium]